MAVLKARVNEDGTLLLPEPIREVMGLGAGDQVLMEMHGDELRIQTSLSALRRLQEKLRPYAPAEGYVSDELIAERRAEAAREALE